MSVLILISLIDEVKNLTLNLNEEQTRRIQELEAELQKAKSVIDFFQGKLESVKDSHAKEKEELNEELAREKEQCTKEMQLIQVRAEVSRATTFILTIHHSGLRSSCDLSD